MSKDPAFLFYTGDFSTGTQFMSNEQVGIFLRLLMAQHQHGHLTDDQVKFICKSYDNHVMSKFVKDSQGLWYNERLESEIIKRKSYCESRGKNKEGKTQQKITSKSYDLHMENENEDINELIKWGQQIVEKNDPVWDKMKGRSVSVQEMDEFLSIATRKKWNMKTQQEFRISLRGFESYKTNGVKARPNPGKL